MSLLSLLVSFLDTLLVIPLSAWLYSLNPALLHRYQHQQQQYAITNNEEEVLCYVDIPCASIHDPTGTLRPNIGSWFLSPQRYSLELLIVGVLCVFWIVYSYPKLVVVRNTNTTIATQQQRKTPTTPTPTTQLRKTIQHPVWMKPLSFLCTSLIVYYKWYGHQNKIFYLVMPCNMTWIIYLVLVWCLDDLELELDNRQIPATPKQPLTTITTTAARRRTTQYYILVLQCFYITGLAFVAIVNPDTSDCTMVFEKHFFFLNHSLLLGIPVVYIWNGSISTTGCSPFSTSNITTTNNNNTMPRTKTRTRTTTSRNAAATIASSWYYWWITACAWFGLFYFVVVTPLAIYTGLNLNYMLSPPPNQVILAGTNFRGVSILCCAATFLGWYSILCIIERYIIVPLQRTTHKKKAGMHITSQYNKTK